MLKYALYRNHLTKGENDFKAIAQGYEIKSIEDIIRQITIPGSILKETECVAVIYNFFGCIAENLEEGHGFACDHIRIHPKVTGVFKGQNDQFDPERHQKKASVTTETVFDEAISKMKLEKIEADLPEPEIKSVYDLKSQQTDALLSPGHLIEILGSKLKINPESTDEGIFLINIEDKSEMKIQHIHTNRLGKLSAMLPDNLASGVYILEVRKRPKKNKTLKTCIYKKQLRVPAAG